MRDLYIPMLLVCLLHASGAAAQQATVSEPQRKQAHAGRVPNGTIRVDGRLTEDSWRTATPLADFVQKEPVEGASPSDRMDVRIVYDDDAVYVGPRKEAYAAIQDPMGRRDVGFGAEQVVVSLDNYLESRTAAHSGTTAA